MEFLIKRIDDDWFSLHSSPFDEAFRPYKDEERVRERGLLCVILSRRESQMKTLLSLFVLASIAAAQPTTTALTGVWQLTDRTFGRNPASTNPGTVLWIFTGKYYSVVGLTGDKPRPDLSAKPTDAERLASLDAIQTETGTYEISGKKLTLHAIVHRNPTMMKVGNAHEYPSFAVDGDKLTITLSGGGTMTMKRLEGQR